MSIGLELPTINPKMSKINNYYMGIQEKSEDSDSDISSYVDSEIHPLLLEREYIKWEISKNKQDLIKINRRIKDEM